MLFSLSPSLFFFIRSKKDFWAKIAYTVLPSWFVQRTVNQLVTICNKRRTQTIDVIQKGLTIVSESKP